MDNQTPNRITKDFVLGGRAIFTVESATGERFTFKVSGKDNERGGGQTYFLAVMTGSANDADSSYDYLGIVNPGPGFLRTTRGSKQPDDAKAVKVARWALAIVWTGAKLPPGYAIHHEGRCGRCARLLTVPASILSGFGPECSARNGKHAAAPVLPLGGGHQLAGVQ
jgi:hypothetical protein